MLRNARLPIVLVMLVATGACTPLDNVLAGIFGRHMRDSRSFDPYENTIAPPPNSVPFAAGNFPPGPGRLNTGQPERGVFPPPFGQLLIDESPPAHEIESFPASKTIDGPCERMIHHLIDSLVVSQQPGTFATSLGSGHEQQIATRFDLVEGLFEPGSNLARLS